MVQMLSADLSVRDSLEELGALGTNCFSKFKIKHVNIKRLFLDFRLNRIGLIKIFGV